MINSYRITQLQVGLLIELAHERGSVSEVELCRISVNVNRVSPEPNYKTSSGKWAWKAVVDLKSPILKSDKANWGKPLKPMQSIQIQEVKLCVLHVSSAFFNPNSLHLKRGQVCSNHPICLMTLTLAMFVFLLKLNMNGSGHMLWFKTLLIKGFV